MISRDDLPETPDWLPARHWDESTEDRLARFRAAVKPHAECPAHVSQPLTWDGDNA